MDLLAGSILLTLLVTLFGMACFAFGKEKRGLALSLLVLAGLILRCYMALSHPYLHPWDERYHALVAKNVVQDWWRPTLYRNPLLEYDYRDWVTNHIWLHKPPLTTWIVGLSYKVFGVNILALRLPSVVMSSLGIVLTYRIARTFYGSGWIAFIAAFLFSIHGLTLELVGGRVSTDHVDIAFLFFVQLGVYFALNTVCPYLTAVLTGVAVGLAFLVKSWPALIVVALWCIWWYGKVSWSRQIVLLCSMLMTTLILVLPWEMYAIRSFPLEYIWEKTRHTAHLTEVIEGHSGGIFYHINKIRIIYGELIYLPLLILLLRVGKQSNLCRAHLVLMAWIFIPVITFSLASTKLPAYTLICSPALFIVTGFGALLYYRIRPRSKYAGAACKLFAVLLIILPVRYSFERVKPFQEFRERPTWMQTIDRLAQEYSDGSKVVVFNAPHPIETMFHVDCTAYSRLPTIEETEQLEKQGYVVIIL